MDMDTDGPCGAICNDIKVPIYQSLGKRIINYGLQIKHFLKSRWVKVFQTSYWTNHLVASLATAGISPVRNLSFHLQSTYCTGNCCPHMKLSLESRGMQQVAG